VGIIAYLWDRWRNPEGDDVLHATIIVSGTSASMAPCQDHMPVLLWRMSLPRAVAVQVGS